MISGSGTNAPNFSKRADKLRTEKQKANHQARLNNSEAIKGGLSNKQFWSSKVKTKEDVELYYTLYHPEYPEILCKALAERFSTIVIKANNGQDLDEQDQKYLKEPQKNEKVWNPLEEIEEQKFIGQMKLSEKKLEELLID